MSINLFDRFDPFNLISAWNTPPFYIDFDFQEKNPRPAPLKLFLVCLLVPKKKQKSSLNRLMHLRHKKACSISMQKTRSTPKKAIKNDRNYKRRKLNITRRRKIAGK